MTIPGLRTLLSGLLFLACFCTSMSHAHTEGEIPIHPDSESPHRHWFVFGYELFIETSETHSHDDSLRCQLATMTVGLNQSDSPAIVSTDPLWSKCLQHLIPPVIYAELISLGLPTAPPVCHSQPLSDFARRACAGVLRI